MFHCPFHLSFHHSRCDAALSLFASKWLGVSCYAFRLAPCDLGDPGWGDPWFPHGAVLLPSPACMALCVSVFPPFCFCYVYGHTMMRWHNVVTSCMNLPWTGSQSFLCVLVFGFVVLFWWFLFVCLVCLLLSVLVVDDDGLLDYVQVLHQFSFVALNSRWPRALIWNYCFCNAIERVKRPGGSHEGVGRKKK